MKRSVTSSREFFPSQHDTMTRRWLIILVLLCFHLGCSSYEFGVYTRVVNPPVLIATLDCKNLGESISLSPTLSVEITSGAQGIGIVQLQRVTMEYCTNAVVAQQSSSSTLPPSQDACEAATEIIHTVTNTSQTSCKSFYKQACLASLRFPKVVTCSAPAPNQPREASQCYLTKNQSFTYQGSKEVPLRSLQQTGFKTRSNQVWGRLCCEIASQECQTTNDCRGRGRCAGQCQYKNQTCTQSADCPVRPQKCLSVCDDLYQQCSQSSECPRPNPQASTLGSCRKRCTLSGSSCNSDTDCPSLPQTCLRYCSNVGTTCTQDKQCARGESCMTACRRSHKRCKQSSDCPAGEECQQLCLSAAQILVYVGFEGDPETGYAEPDRMRLFCRSQTGPFQLSDVCKTPTQPSDPPATVCPSPE